MTQEMWGTGFSEKILLKNKKGLGRQPGSPAVRTAS
jgi:hypothetical protein